MLDAPFFRIAYPVFCADAQYLAHLVDVQYIRVIPEHHTVRITGIQIFLTQTDSPFLFIFSRSNARLHFRAFSICAISHSLVIPIKLLMRSLSMVKICSSSTTDGRLNAGFFSMRTWVGWFGFLETLRLQQPRSRSAQIYFLYYFESQ